MNKEIENLNIDITNSEELLKADNITNIVRTATNNNTDDLRLYLTSSIDVFFNLMYQASEDEFKSNLNEFINTIINFLNSLQIINENIIDYIEVYLYLSSLTLINNTDVNSPKEIIKNKLLKNIKDDDYNFEIGCGANLMYKMIENGISKREATRFLTCTSNVSQSVYQSKLNKIKPIDFSAFAKVDDAFIYILKAIPLVYFRMKQDKIKEYLNSSDNQTSRRKIHFEKANTKIIQMLLNEHKNITGKDISINEDDSVDVQINHVITSIFDYITYIVEKNIQ